MEPRSQPASPQQGENGATTEKSSHLQHQHSSSWTATSTGARRHLNSGSKLAAGASSYSLHQPTPVVPSSASHAGSPRSTSPRATPMQAMVRERSFHREDGPGSSSRPPSIRSASSYSRQLNAHRLMYGAGNGGAHARRHSGYSNFSTMSETSLPWTTRDIGFNAISGTTHRKDSD